MNLIVSAIGQGLLWGILGLGLYLTFRILKFPDMTVEGTFPFGACVCVSLITQGTSPFIATLAWGRTFDRFFDWDLIHQRKDPRAIGRDLSHDRDLLDQPPCLRESNGWLTQPEHFTQHWDVT